MEEKILFVPYKFDEGVLESVVSYGTYRGGGGGGVQGGHAP